MFLVTFLSIGFDVVQDENVEDLVMGRLLLEVVCMCVWKKVLALRVICL